MQSNYPCNKPAQTYLALKYKANHLTLQAQQACLILAYYLGIDKF